MSVSVRPFTLTDVSEYSSGEVTNVITSNSEAEDGTVVSSSIFGSPKERTSDKVVTSSFNRRGHISFAIPILNTFIAGQNAPVWNLILERKRVEDIVNGVVVYDVQKGEELHAQNIEAGLIYNSSRILIGGHYLRYLLQKANVDEIIEKRLLNIVENALWGSAPKGKVMARGYITRVSGKLHLIDDYYYNAFVDWSPEREEDVKQEMLNLALQHNSYFLHMLSVRNNKENFASQIMDVLPVIPIGYRPDVEKQRDPLTKAYNRVVQCNNDLFQALKVVNVRVEEVRTKYRILYDAVRNVMFEKTTIMQNNKRYQPIAQQLKGKEGHIRGFMQSVRTDYSGRSVIVVDPNMSVDEIGIPKSMVAKLMELEILKTYHSNTGNRAGILKEGEALWDKRVKMASELIEGRYLPIGRQPTLYYLGVQSFRVRIVPGDAIVLNPLSTPAYNADFDGDQMYVLAALSAAAQLEVSKLIASTNNLFLPRNGDIHVAPRQEILHGLYIASSAEIAPDAKSYVFDKTAKSFETILNGVCNHEMLVSDKCVFDGQVTTIGRVAIKACLSKHYGDYRLGVLPLTTNPKTEEKPISEKWFKTLMKMIATGEKSDDASNKQNNKRPKSTFVEVTNNLVKLGFAVVMLNPPNISVLNECDVKPLIREFHEETKEREEMYNRGFETLDVYSAYYAEAYAKLEKKVKAYLKDALGDDNGYVDMVLSGCRGSWSNVIQCFGMKGRVAKNARESFNAILERSLSDQLTGLEHFVTAFGARQGVNDKVIATADPGYQSRKMEHTSCITSVTSKDCHTQEGFLLDYDVLQQFLPHHMMGNDVAADVSQVRDYFTSIVIGRYIVGLNDMVKDENMAYEIFDENVAAATDGKLHKFGGVLLRSPLTCQEPCCVKCYGMDLGTNREVVRGTMIGTISAESIGEPGTQLTMKKFQRGGIAGVTDLTSSFELVEKYTHILDMGPRGKEKNRATAINYDFISPVEGYVKTVSLGNGTKKLRIVKTDASGAEVNMLRTSVILHEETELKEYVKRGDSIQKKQGYLAIREMLATRGADETARYLTLMLYDIFKNEAFVNFKHFEVLVAGMMFYVCTKGNKHFEACKYYTLPEYHAGNHEGAEFVKTLEGVKSTTHMRNDVLGSMFLEDIRKGLSRTILTSGKDSLTNPIVRTTLGLRLGRGSDVEDYVTLRGNV